MPRIRTIKPDFFRHHDLYLAETESKLPIRVAFSGLWCCADREGRFKWKPTQLKLDILPYDELNFEKVLECLIKNEFIVKYTINGKEYGIIPTFTEHQRITGTEKQYESKLPEPPKKQQGNNLESRDDSNTEKAESTDTQMESRSVSLETTWIRGKEEGRRNKDNKERNKDSDFIFWENEKKSFLNSGDWIYKFCTDKNIVLEDFEKEAKKFLSDIELKEDFKDLKELKRHFINWYNSKNKNGTKSDSGSDKLGTSAARVQTARKW